MATSYIESQNKYLIEAQSLKKSHTDTYGKFDVNNVSGNVGTCCMNIGFYDDNTVHQYGFGNDLIPSSVSPDKIWVDSGFLQTANGTLPVNFNDGNHKNTCWVEGRNVCCVSNAWSGTAYIVLKYIY